MSDIHALSGAYALDALDDLERQSFQRHLAGCPTCSAEVDGLRETAALLVEVCEATPPAALRARVLAQAANTRPLSPLTANLPKPSGLHRRSPRRLTALVAAAAAVAAVGIGGAVFVTQNSQDGAGSTPVASAPTDVDRVLNAADAETFSKAANGGGTITIVRSLSLNQAVLKTQGLAPVADDETRELWLQHGVQYIPAGYLPDGSDHTILLDGDPGSAKGFGMTVEAASGAITPSENIVALFPFTSA